MNTLRRFLELVFVLTFLVHAETAHATIPARAKQYLPVLKTEIQSAWPTMSLPSSLAGQVEQESCPSLKSRLCWNPRAELKTSREYGFGLGQLTVTRQFNNFEGVKKLDRKLSSWKWADRYNPAYQLRALVVMDHVDYNAIKFPTASSYERLAFMFSAYNGGLGGVLQDRKLCTTIKDCDSTRWFGNVEKHSFKSKIKVHGYGQSFFDVNRSYVKNVLIVRRPKYVPYMENNK